MIIMNKEKERYESPRLYVEKIVLEQVIATSQPVNIGGENVGNHELYWEQEEVSTGDITLE